MSAPVKHTCPDIDRAIKKLKSAMQTACCLAKNNPELKSDLIDIEDECSNAIDYFEDLRNSNDALRNWGKEMEQENEILIRQYDELEAKYNSLLEQQNLVA